MIIREWKARAETHRQAPYAEHFRQRVLPELKGLEGFLGGELLKRDVPGGVEYVVLTRWASLDAIRGFAGPETARAVVEAQAQAALVSFDTSVRHYDVVETTLPAA